MNNVKNLADVSESAMMMTPEMTLKEALNDVGKSGALANAKKILIIGLDDTNGQYDTTWYQSGMRMSDCLALLEVAKTKFLSDMGYINR